MNVGFGRSICFAGAWVNRKSSSLSPRSRAWMYYSHVPKSIVTKPDRLVTTMTWHLLALHECKNSALRRWNTAKKPLKWLAENVQSTSNWTERLNNSNTTIKVMRSMKKPAKSVSSFHFSLTHLIIAHTNNSWKQIKNAVPIVYRERNKWSK